jgi:hypothetical protein
MLNIARIPRTEGVTQKKKKKYAESIDLIRI